MESRIFRILLTPAAVLPLLAISAGFTPATAQEPEQVVRPELERRDIKHDDIDTEDFEIGVFAGT